MKDYIGMMRLKHWSKNVFVFAALLFGGQLIGSIDEVVRSIINALAGFFCFSLASSAIYIFNDIIERGNGFPHLVRTRNPITAGRVRVGAAWVLALVCAAVSLIGGYLLVTQLAVIIAAYLILMICYSIFLKKIMVVDVIVISIGFVLCAMAGAVVIGAFISRWLVICTFALCLFLGFGKRRSELAMLSEDEQSFRRSLGGYTFELLGHMLDVTGGLAIVCFLMYALDDRTVSMFGTANLVYTTPLVLYGVFRFSALIQKGIYSDPVELILGDRPFQLGLLLWVLICMFVVYADKLGFDPAGILAY